MRDTLHWLPVRQRILYRVTTIAWRCILGVAPVYLSELFVLSLSCPGRRSLRSASRGDCLIPRSYKATKRVPRQIVYGHFVYDTSSTDISTTDISSTTVPAYRTVI